MKKIFVPLIAFLISVGCGNKKHSESDKVVAFSPPALSEMKVSDQKNYDASEKSTEQDNKNISTKIIKEGDISFETNNTYKTRNAIVKSLKKLGGYVAEEKEANNGDNGRKEYTLETRIPEKNFDLFVNSVSSSADRIDTKNIRVKDVTAQYIDISTQLANKKKLEERYLELLQKGNKISDLLQIENKLTEIQSDIESTQGQLNYLEKQVDYSSLEVTFYSRQIIKDDGQNFFYKLKTSFSEGWDILGALFFGFISTWPVWIIIIVLFLLIRLWRKRNRRKKSEQQS